MTLWRNRCRLIVILLVKKSEICALLLNQHECWLINIFHKCYLTHNNWNVSSNEFHIMNMFVLLVHSNGLFLIRSSRLICKVGCCSERAQSAIRPHTRTYIWTAIWLPLFSPLSLLASCVSDKISEKHSLSTYFHFSFLKSLGCWTACNIQRERKIAWERGIKKRWFIITLQNHIRYALHIIYPEKSSGWGFPLNGKWPPLV